ncbi:CBS domain-containing protein [Gordonibacter sp. 28C]|uniref:CBS domain-containing protein n=1 Tax=Gordonibacter sp. 28C TaxID=2078569 RepID=UPI000DF7EEEA|nr:CBS domain-containing protein [Gordonibacter sp. 28C]RDB62037.1 CBS domain-containing protein [Gordonibacter sp. 28C]
MKHPVKDIMEQEAYTCRYDQTLGEVVQIFSEKGTSGITVVDEDDRVVGFISDGDIMKAVAEQKTRSIFSGYSTMLLYDNESFEDKARALKDRNVMELATKKVLCVLPDQSVGSVADILGKRKYKKIPVVDDKGVLVGVVRRATITRYIFRLLFGEEV